MSSCAHESPGKFRLEDLPKPSGNGGYGAYKRSKLCNILFTYELARRLEGENVTANALHPGLVRTNIARNNGLLGRVVNFFIGVRGITPDKGAETPVYLAASPEVEGVTGKYFVDCCPVPSAGISYDAELAARLWDMSASLTAAGDPPSALKASGRAVGMANHVFRALRYDLDHPAVRGNEAGCEHWKDVNRRYGRK